MFLKYSNKSIFIGQGRLHTLNHTLLNMLATMMKEQPGDWDSSLFGIQQQHSGKKVANTPFIMFCRDARLPLDLMYDSDTSEPATHSEYAIRVKDSLEKAYDWVKAKFGQKQQHKKSSTTRSVMRAHAWNNHKPWGTT